jgi:ABC-type antimicrobial peptide transport system permease subunit
MNDILDNEISGQKTHTTIVLALAIIALLLASVGLYGVLSYTVAQRTAEIGIRRALGAQPGEAIRGVMVQALRWTAIGTACGLVGALGLTRLFSALLFEVSPSDPQTYVAVTVVLATIALLASFVPARRAATVDPMVALRHD